MLMSDLDDLFDDAGVRRTEGLDLRLPAVDPAVDGRPVAPRGARRIRRDAARARRAADRGVRPTPVADPQPTVVAAAVEPVVAVVAAAVEAPLALVEGTVPTDVGASAAV